MDLLAISDHYVAIDIDIDRPGDTRSSERDQHPGQAHGNIFDRSLMGNALIRK
jgi:hypothetical protein